METPNLTKSAAGTSRGTDKVEEEVPYANEEFRAPSFKENTATVESLDEFLSKNTSEDNVSFDMLINDAEKKQRAKTHQAWLFEKEQLHQLKSAESMLMIEDNKPDDISKSLDTWTYKSKNTLMFVPDGKREDNL